MTDVWDIARAVARQAALRYDDFCVAVDRTDGLTKVSFVGEKYHYLRTHDIETRCVWDAAELAEAPDLVGRIIEDLDGLETV